jgi:hypothetical protein
LLMLTELTGGCAGNNRTGSAVSSQSLHAHTPSAGEVEVVTGTATPHKQKDSPVETERITGLQLEEAGATHIGQTLQDVPAIQPKR